MIQLGYILLSLTMFFILIAGYSYALKTAEVSPQKRKKKLTFITVVLLAWFGYTYTLATSGVFQNLDLPPRFVVFLIIPAFTFIGITVYRLRNSGVLTAIPPSWLIYYQSFRIVIESLFVATVGIGVLHPEVTFKGYNFDIIFALTAPFVAYLVFSRNALPQKAALYWNYLGLAVIASIIFLFLTTTYLPSLYGSSTSMINTEFLDFPYPLVPAFLMPSAVFVHTLSIVQLRKLSKE